MIGWAVLLIYMFYPSKFAFNAEGRLYLFKILKNMIASCFFVDFTLSWATDQLVSFVIPIRDLEYTVCYYVNHTFLDQNAEVCLNQEKITIAFIAAFIPLMLRIIQCIRSMYQKEHRFAVNTDFYNMVKYLCSLTTVFFSLGLNLDPSNYVLFYIWIVFASISTCYSYFWDLKMDWGFLDPKAKYLRPQLSYNKKIFYYVAIAINLLFRFSWILSLSSAVVDKTMRKELYTFLLGFIEMTRRSIWNFFRVEKEHIANCGLFRVVENYKLPYDNIKYNIDEKKLTYTEFENYDAPSAYKKKMTSFREGPQLSLLANNMEELINRLKIPPKYTLEIIMKEITEFKNFVERGFHQKFIINEDEDLHQVLHKGNNNTFSSHRSNNEDFLVNDNSQSHQDESKLQRSIHKFMRETSWKQPIMESPEENVMKKVKKKDSDSAIHFNPKRLQTFSIEKIKDK